MSSNQALTQVPQDKLAPFRQALARAEGHFRMALPATVAKYLTPERLTKITLAAISRTPLLLQCTPESVLRSVMDSASLGLEPTGGVLGHAYLVPYRNGKTGRYEAQLIVGYRGLIDLARRSGQIQSVEAHVVYERDDLIVEYGRDPKLSHKPSFAADRGEIVAVYAVAQFTDGTKHCEFMTRAEVDAVRMRSRARDSGPWQTDYAEMARKTVVRRAAKYWPLSTELVRAIDMEDDAESGTTTDVAGLAFSDEAPAGGSPESTPAQETKPPKTRRLVEKIRGGSKEEREAAFRAKNNRAQEDEPHHDPETGEVSTTTPDVDLSYGPPPFDEQQ